MRKLFSESVNETMAYGEQFAKKLHGGEVVAFFGDLGMGKTAFIRGMAKTLSPDAFVSSPTFALVHEYDGNPKLCHFDMYRVSSWEDLYSTGFFDYMDSGAVLAIEWSENIENALPKDAIRITISKGENDNQRIIEIVGENDENIGNR